MLIERYKKNGLRVFAWCDVYTYMGYKPAESSAFKKELDSANFIEGRNAMHFKKYFINENGAKEYCHVIIKKSTLETRIEKAKELLKWLESTAIATQNIAKLDDYRVFSFNNFPIRAKIIDGDFYFQAKNVCDILGFKNSRDAVLTHVFPEDVASIYTLTRGGNQLQSHINESGLYALIFGSRLPIAKAFKKWVTGTVLPEIRKTGGYGSSVGQLTELEQAYVKIQLEAYRREVAPLLKKIEDEQAKNKSLMAVMQEASDKLLGCTRTVVFSKIFS